ncbi:hypothetical protein VKT23_012894 [Stygiomarasmius scandens]|uniref:DUF6534 domain-containing protein n=1 Tax=Marasmiellus scandens TaxID=2682957 RepID=A0ABR1J5B5_9AGAR
MVTISFSTGSIAAALAVFAVIFFARNPKTNAAPSIAWSIGRVYAISTLFTLNNRHRDNGMIVSANGDSYPSV